MNTCLNNIFCYCAGTPKAATKEEEISVAPHTDNKNTGIKVVTRSYCKLDTQTCGYYKTSIDMPGYAMALAKLGKKK